VATPNAEPAPGETLVLARGQGRHGEVALRRRGQAGTVVHELIVNGVFAMDSTETSSERELARFVPTGTAGARVLVGGLGLGYTAAEVLDQPNAAEGQVDVVELEPQLVGWARAGLTPVLSRVAGDPRTRLHIADISDVLRGAAEPSGPWDAILLDVDNGPDFLIHADNRGLYGRQTLQSGYDRLTPGGVLAIWCQGPAPALLETLQTIAPSAQEHRYAVSREGREFSYLIYTVIRAAGPSRRVAPSPDAEQQ
jgi:spermidine synthase